MTKVVHVTEEMAHRFNLNLMRNGTKPLDTGSVIAALHCALNPSTPEEPEIAVSEAMVLAGMKAARDSIWMAGERYYCAQIFKAMESIRRKEQVVCGAPLMGRESERVWRTFQSVQRLPWYHRMAGPGAVIPMTDPRCGARRK